MTAQSRIKSRSILAGILCAPSVYGFLVEQQTPRQEAYFHYLVGELELNRGKFAQAAHHLHRAQNFKPVDAIDRSLLRLHAQTGQLNRLSGLSQKSFSNDIESQLILAQTYLHSQQPDKANKLLSKLSKKAPSNAQVAYARTLALMAQEKFDQALSYARLFAERTSHDQHRALFCFLQSRILAHQNKIQDALAKADEAILLHRRFDKAWYFKAALLEKMGDITGAATAYEEYLEVHGMSRDVAEHLVELLFNSKRYDRAIHWMKRRGVQTAADYFNLALIEKNRGNHDQARAYADQALKQDASFSKAWLIKIMSAFNGKDEKTAFATLRSWFASSPSYGDPLRACWDLYRSGVDPRRIVAVLDEVVAQKGYHKNIEALRGDLLLVSGKVREAVNAYQAILKHTRDHILRAKIWYQIGYIFLRAQNLDKAYEAFERSLFEHGEHAPSYHLMAHILLAQGKHDKALQAVNRALERDPQNPLFLDTKGIVLLTSGEREQARLALRTAARLVPHNKVIQQHKQEAEKTP